MNERIAVKSTPFVYLSPVILPESLSSSIYPRQRLSISLTHFGSLLHNQRWKRLFREAIRAANSAQQTTADSTTGVILQIVKSSAVTLYQSSKFPSREWPYILLCNETRTISQTVGRICGISSTLEVKTRKRSRQLQTPDTSMLKPLDFTYPTHISFESSIAGLLCHLEI